MIMETVRGITVIYDLPLTIYDFFRTTVEASGLTSGSRTTNSLPCPRICHRYIEKTPCKSGTHGHAPAIRGEFERIIHQVGKDLRQAVAITGDGWQPGKLDFQCYTSAARLGRETLAHAVEQGRQIDRGALQVGDTGIETRQ